LYENHQKKNNNNVSNKKKSQTSRLTKTRPLLYALVSVVLVYLLILQKGSYAWQFIEKKVLGNCMRSVVEPVRLCFVY